MRKRNTTPSQSAPRGLAITGSASIHAAVIHGTAAIPKLASARHAPTESTSKIATATGGTSPRSRPSGKLPIRRGRYTRGRRRVYFDGMAGLVVSVDTEEEGLFRGEFPAQGQRCSNVLE